MYKWLTPARRKITEQELDNQVMSKWEQELRAHKHDLMAHERASEQEQVRSKQEWNYILESGKPDCMDWYHSMGYWRKTAYHQSVKLVTKHWMVASHKCKRSSFPETGNVCNCVTINGPLCKLILDRHGKDTDICMETEQMDMNSTQYNKKMYTNDFMLLTDRDTKMECSVG